MIKITELSIHQHLQMQQDIINRMSEKSSTIKNLCVTLVSALIVFILSKNGFISLLLVLIPIVIFATLNAYYLAQEKRFRKNYNDFVKGLSKISHKENMSEVHVSFGFVNNLFELSPKGSLCSYYAQALKSPSLLTFYGGLLVMVVIINCVF